MKMDSNTKMNASMKDQYIDRFFEATMNGNEDIVRQLLKGTKYIKGHMHNCLKIKIM